MMLLSVLATLSFLALSYRYLVKCDYATNWQALMIVALAALNWRTLILATTILSEMMYAALTVAALWLAEKFLKEQNSRLAGSILGVILGLAFLTRTAGLALFVAVCVHYVLRRQWRRAVLPMAVGSMFVLGWIGWCYLNKTTATASTTAYYTSYFRVSYDLISQMQVANHTSKLMVVLTLLLKNTFMLVAITPTVICFGLTFDWPQVLPPQLFNVGLGIFIIIFCLIVRGFWRLKSKRIRLLHLYILLYLGLHAIWPYPIYDRFLMPLICFLELFLVAELTAIFRLVRKELDPSAPTSKRISAAFVGLAMLFIAVALPYTYWLGYRQFLSYSSHVAAGSLQDSKAIEWIAEQTDTSAILLCASDPKYYLYTGRKATRSAPMRGPDLVKESDITDQVLRIIDESDATYLILPGTASRSGVERDVDPYEKAYEELIDSNPKGFIPAYVPGDESVRIYRLNRSAGPIRQR
jgi:4-amino-4-deoxy-L-arabinose transferase-like glycosyltransferase